jgi:hypothetical protein
MKIDLLKHTALAMMIIAGIAFTSCKDNNAGSDADTDPDTELLDAEDTSPVDTVKTADGDTIIDTEGTRRLDENAADDQEP